VRLPEGVAAGSQRHRLLVVHRHSLEGDLDVACGAERIGDAAGAFGIDVDEAHLDRRERVFEFQLLFGQNAGLVVRVPDKLLFGAPVDVALRLEHVPAPAAETEDGAAHGLDGDVAGQDEEVGPADVLAVFALDRPQQAPRLVEVAVVGPGVERGEALLTAVGAAASVGRAVRTRGVPCHADEQRPIMPVICRPPGLAVGHQGGEVGLERLVVERVERGGVIELVAHRVGREAALIENVQRKRLRPPVAVRSTEE
jgi:hypothetical protein